MNAIDLAASIVGAEVEAAGKAGDPEWLAGAAMAYVQPRVRPWREAARIEAGYGFTLYPDILTSESGYCGSCILVWRGILGRHGIETRQVGFMWETPLYDGPVGHVCGEAWWNREWHFFDVMTGTIWHDGKRILSWEQVRLNPDEREMRVSNEAAIRYTSFEEWFAVDPFAYLHVDLLEVKVVTDFP